MRCHAVVLASVALGWMGATAVRADEVVLASGEVLRGEIVAQTDEAITLEHPILGALAIPRDRIASWLEGEAPTAAPGGDAAAAAPAEGEAAAPTPAEEVADEGAAALEAATEADDGWDSRFELGFSSSTGNTDAQSLNVGIRSTRETERMKTAFDALYFYGATDGDRNTNKFTTGVLNDWLFPDESRWLFFAQGRYDFDEFQSWEHRLTAATGPGYRFIDTETFDLTLRAGGGVAKEIGSKRNQLIPEALTGGDLSWKINDRQDLTAATTFFWDLDETGEFRNTSTAAWNLTLDTESNMKFSLGLLNEYQSQVDPGVKHNDLKVFGALVFDF